MKHSVNYLIKKAIKEIAYKTKKNIGTCCKKSYSENTPIKLGLSQSDFSKISYTTEKRQNDLIDNGVVKSKSYSKEQRKKYFYHTSIEKLLKKFFIGEIENQDFYKDIILNLKRDIFDLRLKDSNVYSGFVCGSDIGKAYNTTDHRLGTMSCMQEKPTWYFDIYSDLPVEMFVLYFNDTLMARCLVWKGKKYKSGYLTKEDIFYIDRIYTYVQNDDLSKHIYKKLIDKILRAKKVCKNETIYAWNVRHCNYDTKSSRSFPPFNSVQLWSTELSDYDKFPYLDTFQFGGDDTLTTDGERETEYQFDSTCGDYTDYKQTECECCGASIESEDDEIYIEGRDEIRCVDCSRWSDLDSTWYAEEDAVYIRGNVNDYVYCDDIDN